jgi:hypothetical protein
VQEANVMLLSSVRVDFWCMSAHRGAFVVWYSGERDSGVKCEKTSVRPSMSIYFVGFTRTGMVNVAQLNKVAPIAIFEFAHCVLHLQS